MAHLYKFRSYLERNFDFKTLVAFNYMCECLKSVILAVALLERRVTSVEEACALANLEQSFQFDRWGAFVKSIRLQSCELDVHCLLEIECPMGFLTFSCLNFANNFSLNGNST